MGAKSLQSCPTLCDPMDCSPLALLSRGFSRQEYPSGLPCPPPGDLPKPRIKPTSLMTPALPGRFFTTWVLNPTVKSQFSFSQIKFSQNSLKFGYHDLVHYKFSNVIFCYTSNPASAILSLVLQIMKHFPY